jgi:hypothetical protein
MGIQIFISCWLLWAMFTFLRVLWFMIAPPNPVGLLKTSWVFVKDDMWIGAYLDRSNKRAYWFPIPCVGRKFWRE